MNIPDMLKGKYVNVKSDTGVVVVLIIESVKEEKHAVDLEPSTRENDWWPKQRKWTTFEVKFTNGFDKSYSNLSDIEILK